MNNKLLSGLLVVFTTLSVQATEETSGWWLGTFSKKKISDEVSGWMETQIRYNWDTGATNQILYRTGLLYQLNENHEIGALYGVIYTNGAIEHRGAFQHSMKYFSSESSSLTHRTRVEARYFRGTDNDSYRFRYLLKYSHKLNQVYKLSVWNESFINISDEEDRGQDSYERNRFFLGTDFSFYEISASVGYLNQYVPREAGDTMEHLAVIYWNF